MSTNETTETERVLRLLETAVHVSGMPKRRLEMALGVSRGYLTQVFNGRIELKYRHIHDILTEIGMDPLAFFQMAYGQQQPQQPTKPAGRGTVAELLAAFQSMGFAPGPIAPPKPATPGSDQLQALIKAAVREVLAEDRGGEGKAAVEEPLQPKRRGGRRAVGRKG